MIYEETKRVKDSFSFSKKKMKKTTVKTKINTVVINQSNCMTDTMNTAFSFRKSTIVM